MKTGAANRRVILYPFRLLYESPHYSIFYLEDRRYTHEQPLLIQVIGVLMNPQLHESARDTAPEPDNQTPPRQQSSMTTVARRLWAGWVWLTGPKAEHFSKDLAAQERLRRARLISALLLLLVAVLCFFLPSALGGYSLAWMQMSIMASCGVVAAALNRRGQVTLSALVMTLLVDITLIQFILSLPNLNTTNLADLDLFVLAVLVGGILLPRWLIVSTGAGQIAIILLLFYLKPHDPLLDVEIAKYEAGLGYAALTDPILLQICGATIALLQESQARVANGEYSARIELQGNELLPVAISFNLMAERLSRNQRIQQTYQNLEQAVQHLLDTLMALEQNAALVKFAPTGTLVDLVFPYLAQLRTLTIILRQSMPLAEEASLTLQRQQTHLAHIEANLTNTLLLTRELASVTAQAQPLHTSRPLHRLESSRNYEPILDLPRLHLLLERQTALLEQTQQHCAQSRELSLHGVHHARTLTRKLKEAS